MCVVGDFGNRLQLSPDADIATDDLLKDIPVEAAALARKLWTRRAELQKWVAAGPERAQRLIAEPERVMGELFPNLTLPPTIPGSELKKEILKRIQLQRVQPKLELPDPKVVDAVTLFRRLLDRVAAGTTSRAQIAADPEAAVQAAAVVGTSPDAMSRVALAIRFVLGLPQAIVILESGIVHIAAEALGNRVHPPRPPR